MQKNFLYLADSVFPEYDSAIEHIYMKSIRSHGYLPYMMFFSKTSAKKKVFKKNNAIIILVPYKRASFGLFSKLNNYLRIASTVRYLSKRKKFTFVQVRNNFIFELITLTFRKSRKYKTVYQITFPTIDSKISMLKENASGFAQNFKIKTLQRIKNYILNRVDYAITMSSKMTEVMKAKYPKPVYHALPMGITEDFIFDSDKETKLKKQLNIMHDDKIILYFGNIRKVRKIEFIFRLAEKFLKENTSDGGRHKIKFLILYRRAPEEARYKKLIEEMGLTGMIIFKEEVPREDVPYYIKMAYVSLSPIPLTDIYMQSSPTKCIESIAYNCPVIASEIPDQIYIVNNSGGGFISSYEVNAFYEKITKLLENVDLRNEIAGKGRDYILSNRGYKVLTKDIAEFYDKVI